MISAGRSGGDGAREGDEEEVVEEDEVVVEEEASVAVAPAAAAVAGVEEKLLPKHSIRPKISVPRVERSAQEKVSPALTVT